MLKEPQQKRSEATLQRILAVCENLIDQGQFEQASMQDIARAAEVSVGTLYKRFDAKAAIVDYLVERLQTEQYQQMLEELEAYEHPRLADRLHFFADLIYRSTSQYAGLLRTVTARHLLGSSPRSTTSSARSAQLMDNVAQWLNASEDSPGIERCRNTFAMVLVACQYRVIYPTPDAMLGADVYKQVIVEMAEKYLGA